LKNEEEPFALRKWINKKKARPQLVVVLPFSLAQRGFAFCPKEHSLLFFPTRTKETVETTFSSSSSLINRNRDEGATKVKTIISSVRVVPELRKKKGNSRRPFIFPNKKCFVRASDSTRVNM